MNILDSVVRNGHCCSCGMCAAICPGRHLQMRETDHGEYRPQTTGSCPDRCSMCVQVCPFSNEHGENEDTLGRQWFGSGAACAHDDALGWVRDTFVGGVADEAQRLQAPSGGLASALLCRLLQLGEIDASIVLQPLARRPWWQSRIAETDQQVLASRGSVYHVAPFDKTLADVLGGPERSYAVVALPCAAKSLRLAQRRIPALRRRIRYVLGSPVVGIATCSLRIC